MRHNKVHWITFHNTGQVLFFKIGIVYLNSDMSDWYTCGNFLPGAGSSLENLELLSCLSIILLLKNPKAYHDAVIYSQ